MNIRSTLTLTVVAVNEIASNHKLYNKKRWIPVHLEEQSQNQLNQTAK